MSIEISEEKSKESVRPSFDNHSVRAPRCPDYDEDCALVADPVTCFCGGAFLLPGGEIAELDMAQGYCPFVIGMK